MALSRTRRASASKSTCCALLYERTGHSECVRQSGPVLEGPSSSGDSVLIAHYSTEAPARLDWLLSTLLYSLQHSSCSERQRAGSARRMSAASSCCFNALSRCAAQLSRSQLEWACGRASSPTLYDSVFSLLCCFIARVLFSRQSSRCDEKLLFDFCFVFAVCLRWEFGIALHESHVNLTGKRLLISMGVQTQRHTPSKYPYNTIQNCNSMLLLFCSILAAREFDFSFVITRAK